MSTIRWELRTVGFSELRTVDATPKSVEIFLSGNSSDML